MPEKSKLDYLLLPKDLSVATARLMGYGAIGGVRLGLRVGEHVGRGLLARTVGTRPPAERILLEHNAYDMALHEREMEARDLSVDPQLADSLALGWVSAVLRKEPERPVDDVIEDAGRTLMQNGTPPRTVEVAVDRLCAWTGVPHPVDDM